jgi:hypothetical protein
MIEMSKYDALKKHSRTANADKRLSTFRMELIPLMGAIKGYTELMLHKISNSENAEDAEDAEDYIKCLNAILAAANDIDELREILLNE